MTVAPRRGWAAAVETVAVYVIAVVLGFALLVAGFKAGLLSGISILFYRGTVITGVAAIATFLLLLAAGRRRLAGIRLPAREAFAAAMLSASLNLSFLVLFPVTVDRSITVFMLAHMERMPPEGQSAAEIRDAFVARYLGEYRQIERRLVEQTVSGNVAPAGDRFVLTGQGRRFLRVSRVVAWLFDTDPRFVGTTPAAAPRP